MIRLNDILDKVQGYFPEADLDLIQRAYVFSAKSHQGQVRKSGEPYLIHPMGVADIIADLHLDVPSICAGLLHDVIEDTLATPQELKELFGPEISFIVEGVTKLSQIPFNAKEEAQAENIRKMVVAMSQDIRVLLVKLADRLHNMRTLSYLSSEKQARIAQETIDIYSPLAHRLGIAWVKSELEDLSFRYIAPDEYQALKEKVNQKKKEREAYTEKVIQVIKDGLKKYGFDKGEVSGRPKHFYSIWRKMKAQEIEFEQIHDAVAFRVLVDNIAECYAVLGIVHQLFTPIPNRFKDYIALPKPNMYQSLHTTVIGPQGQRIEVQIRTFEMHRVAEDGIAAHWLYKAKKGANNDPKEQSKFGWLRQIMEMQKEVDDPRTFYNSLKLDLFADEVFVVTPKGDVMSFPQTSTPLDFAFAVHTEVGTHCTGARVNGSIVPLKYQLQNGDIVEVTTSPSQKPKKEWLALCATSRAKNKIRQFIRAAEREKAKLLGREILEKELRRFGLSAARLEKKGQLEQVAQQLKVNHVEELFSCLGYGKISPEDVAQVILPKEEFERLREKKEEPKEEGRFAKLLSKVTGKSSPTGIRIDGVEDVLVRFARCCNPLPGDPILGFITRGRGVTVHTLDCDKAFDLDPQRRIDVQWDTASNTSEARTVSVKIVTTDKPGILANLSNCFSNGSVNIAQANCVTTADGKGVNTFVVSVKNLAQLNSVLKAIQKLDGVFSVERLKS
jgi:guanosine-3',5'-bis(diphosphate) 3'-pyrophosphohydrolase